ncbi:hypothetical protein [Loigolactobacillus jiayinensis]|uniref:Uncharacterized protein n=1 Tax=Loigolactobacillus jiayinensis TaxID=2486016 RepID=A0ABW1RF98_9LACO|nr:hypothetical protein [Loigolactobacillus jiayinensis]
MNEIVFFNPGDAIASGHDFNEAMRSAEIFHRDQKQNELMIVKEINGETYAIFNAADAKQDATSANRYHISKRL